VITAQTAEEIRGQCRSYPSMISPVSSAYASYASQVPQPAPKAQPQSSNPVPQDTVSLKSVGDVDHDSDSK